MVEDADDAPAWGVVFDGPGPRALADMNSISANLAFAEAAFARAAEEPEDGVVRKALWDAASIAYRRGFTKGKALTAGQAPRLTIPAEVISGLDEEHRSEHERTLEAANRHIAHRVNDHEQVNVILVLANPEVAERAIIGLVPFHVKLVGGAPERCRRMASIARVLHGWVSEQAQQLGQRVLETAIETQDIDELYANPFAGPLAYTKEPGTAAGSAGDGKPVRPRTCAGRVPPIAGDAR